jgi:hypothetical protein
VYWFIEKASEAAGRYSTLFVLGTISGEDTMPVFGCNRFVAGNGPASPKNSWSFVTPYNLHLVSTAAHFEFSFLQNNHANS